MSIIQSVVDDPCRVGYNRLILVSVELIVNLITFSVFPMSQKKKKKLIGYKHSSINKCNNHYLEYTINVAC